MAKKPTPAMKAALIGLEPPVPAKKHSRTLAEGRRPGSGRPANSKDKVLDELFDAIYATWSSLHKEKFLLTFAKSHPEKFVSHVLSRIMPAVPRDPEILVQQNNVNAGDLSDFEVARRIAFVLASGHEAQKRMLAEQGLPIEVDTPPRPSPAMIPLPSVEYPSQFSEEQLNTLVQEQREQKINDLVRDTLDGTYGHADEMGFVPRRKRSLY